MMLARGSAVQVCLSPIDFRKSIDALALLVSAELDADPLSGTLYVFFVSVRPSHLELSYFRWHPRPPRLFKRYRASNFAAAKY